MGTGDDGFSWGFDGKRSQIWCGSGRSVANLNWKDGDVVGFMCNFSTSKMAVYTNGKRFTETVDIPKDAVKLFPCITGRDMQVS